jgi:ribulose-5-phosphate 4-epimerase/fuculose-1-phosphate aldolase
VNFAVFGEPRTDEQRWFVDGTRRALAAHGHSETGAEQAPRIALYLSDRDAPRGFRRHAQATFVASILEGPMPRGPVLPELYPLLIRTLGNVMFYLTNGPTGRRVLVVTLEQGYFPIEADSDDVMFDGIFRRLEPLASAQLVINNEFHRDLEPDLWSGDALTGALAEAGRRLDRMNLLPTPFPIEELLDPRELTHLRRLFGLGGLSYGNLSVRRDATRFWMSASGVNKAAMKTVGRDMLLVKGYDADRNVIMLSVPPDVEPRRVSVDAIEHWMIYTQHPGVGAIIHVHAWMDGVPSTLIQYPCGTLQLAESVAGLIRAAAQPSRAVIGMRNHGLTITGPSLDDIFQRIDGRLLPRVPMS